MQGRPQVAYKETVKKQAMARVPYKRQSGGKGQYGDCELVVEPLEAGQGFEFVNKTVGWLDSERVHRARFRRVSRKPWKRGVSAGYPMVDHESHRHSMARIHEVDSSEMAFKIAAFYDIPRGGP